MKKSQKINFVSDFLDYGGSELFSSIMCFTKTRADAENRLTELLKTYTDNLWLQKSKGRSGAYRFMTAKAAQKGWLKKKSDLHKAKLTAPEREHIVSNVTDYVNSGGFMAIVFKKTAVVLSVVCVISALFAMTWKYVTSEEYYKKTAAYFSSGITINLNNNKNNEELEFSIIKSDNITAVYMEKAPVIYKDGKKVDTFSGYYLDEELTFTDSENSFLIPLGIYDCNFEEGNYTAEFDFEILTDDEKKKKINNVVCEFVVE